MYIFNTKNKTQIFKVVLFFLIFTFFPHITNAANLSITPPTGTFEKGDSFAVKVMVTDNNVLFNAVSGVVSFPASMFKVESVSKSNSVLNFWVTEPVSSSNSVKFEGVALGGFTGFTGTVVTINLRAIAVGSGDITFKSGQILANDGSGTDITSKLIGAKFTINEASIKPIIPKEFTPEIKIEVPQEQIQPLPSLKSPEIILSSKYGVPAILGTSEYPKAEVVVTFMAGDGGKVFIVGKAEADGSFTLLIPKSLKRGLYKVSAVMVKGDKTNSETSNTVNVLVGNIFSDVALEIWLLMSLLCLTIIYLFIRIYLHFNNDKNIHKIIKHEVAEAENIVHKSFDILREDIIDYDSKKISIAERKRMNDLKKDIDSAEKVITKEVDDIQ